MSCACLTSGDRNSGAAVYNYRPGERGADREGASVFYRGHDDTIYHTYSTYARGIDLLNTTYNFLDLTPKGRDLQIALAGLRQRGDKYLSCKPPRVLRRRSDRKPVVAAFVPKGSEVLRADEIESVPGPGSR